MRLLSLFLTFLSLSLVHAGGDRDQIFGNKRMQLVGKSGQIRVLPANATKGDVFTQLNWLKLEEWDTNNRAVQSINNFASQDATWGAPQSDTVMANGVSIAATSIALTGTVSVGHGQQTTSVPLVVKIYLFNRNVSVDNGNTTVYVDVNSIKFNVQINGWPFQSVNNSLAFGVTLTSGGGRGQPDQTRNIDSDNGPRRGRAHQVMFGPGSIVSPLTATVDGVANTPITVNYDGNRNLVWIFPHFASTLVYDPVLGTDGSTSATGGNNAGTMMQPSLLVLLLSFITMWFRA